MNAPSLILAALGLLGVAAATDARQRRIPNVVTAPLALLGLADAGLRAGLDGAALSLTIACATVAILLLPFRRGWLGAGDVKLLAATAAWLDVGGAARLALYTALLGGLLAVVMIMLASNAERTRLRDRLAAIAHGGLTGRTRLASPTGGARVEPGAALLGGGVPYGVAIAGAGAILLLSGGR